MVFDSCRRYHSHRRAPTIFLGGHVGFMPRSSCNTRLPPAHFSLPDTAEAAPRISMRARRRLGFVARGKARRLDFLHLLIPAAIRVH